MIFVENKEIVLPGSLLTDNNYKLGRGTYKENGKIYSSITGLVYFESEQIKVIPLKDTYSPNYGDLVIGRVTGSSYSSWSIDINSTYHGFLPTTELYDKNEPNINNIINIMLLLNRSGGKHEQKIHIIASRLFNALRYVPSRIVR